VLLSLSVVVSNTLINFAYRNQDEQSASWLTSLTPETAIALSFRAALSEEIIFRFFLFPLATWLSKHFIKSHQASLVVGAMASTLAFGFIHGAGFAVALLTGLVLIYIYHQRGLLLAMIVHFFADMVPFVLLSMTL
jgi:membrane protease YdiL (CAAX protease family)